MGENKIYLKLFEDNNNTIYEIEGHPFNKNIYNITIYANANIPLDKILINSEQFNTYLNTLNPEKIEEDIIFNEGIIELINKHNNNEINLLEDINTICIDYYPNKGEIIKKYIEKNPILRTKKVIIDDDKYEINQSNLNNLKSLYGEYENIYVYTEGNDEAISIEDFEKTLTIINKYVKKIESYNFSPLEKIMYAYDLVRDRIYKEETERESATTSRDLTSVLLGDKIVCVGYAHIFEKILKELGINVMTYKISNKDPKKHGHRRNVVYINDKKYKIEGIYYFDTTWDSKIKEDNNDFLNKYRYFAKTKKEIETLQKKEFNDATFIQFNQNISKEFEKSYDENGIKGISKQLYRTINNISNLVDNKNLINPLMMVDPRLIKDKIEKEEIIKKLSYYLKLMDNPIDIIKLLKILYNVRKMEYYECPEKYKFDIETLFEIALNSRWSFKNSIESLLTELLRDFGYWYNSESIKEQLENHKIKPYLELNIERVKLAKTLRKIKENNK